MNNKSGSEQKCDECDFPYSYDPTDGGTVCVRCLKEKRDHLQKLVEEQKGELEAFRKSSIWYAYKTVVDESLALKSQLAEQTERVSRLEGALRYMLYDRTTAGLHISEVCSKSAFDRAEQALNQERLGDGKWRCAHCNAWNVHDIFNCLNCEKPRPPVSLGDGGKGE